MNWRQITFIILYILLAAYLSGMQYIEKDTFGESFYLKLFAAFTYNNRFLLSTVIAAVLTLSSIIVVLFQPGKVREEFRDSLADGIFEQILDNDRTKARITLFRDANWLNCLWYKVLDFFGLWRRGWELRRILTYCWEAKYIKILKRWGTDHKKSRTHFCFNTETSRKCQGIAGQVRQREEMIVAELPNIVGVDLNIVGESDPVVREYMKKGYISDFRVLKSIQIPAPFIYGNFISASGGKKKIVLVIDSWADKSPFTKRQLDLLSTYAKQISASFGS